MIKTKNKKNITIDKENNENSAIEKLEENEFLKSKEEVARLMKKQKQILSPEAIRALELSKTVLGGIQQIIWERDTAIEQLNDLGYEFGERIPEEVRCGNQLL